MINTLLHEDVINQVGNPVVCLIRKLKIVSPEKSHLDADIESIMEVVKKQGAASYERLSDCTKPAHEKLLNNFSQNGFRRHNNLIDASNIASLQHNVSIGLHDGSGVTEDIHIELSSNDQKITPLFSRTEKKIPKGQLIYRTGKKIMAWIGSSDIDSDDFKITESTSNALIVVLGNSKTLAAENRNVCLRVLKLLKNSSPDIYGQIIPTIRVASKNVG